MVTEPDHFYIRNSMTRLAKKGVNVDVVVVVKYLAKEQQVDDRHHQQRNAGQGKCDDGRGNWFRRCTHCRNDRRHKQHGRKQDIGQSAMCPLFGVKHHGDGAKFSIYLYFFTHDHIHKRRVEQSACIA